MASIYIRWKEAFQRYGVRGVYDKITSMGTVKFGRLVGEDHMGNKYYEDLNEYHGQHRWVEYKDIWNYDATMVPPSWHGWLHHSFDEPGDKSEEFLKNKPNLKIDNYGDEIYDHHVGYSTYKDGLLTNPSSKRYRGYKIGAIHQDPNEPEGYYKQPGSATREDDWGEYKRTKGYEPFDPEQKDPNFSTVGPLRPYDKI